MIVLRRELTTIKSHQPVVPSVGRRGGDGEKVVGVRIVGAGMRKGGDLIPAGSCQELWSR